jgi:hypothetical protein
LAASSTVARINRHNGISNEVGNFQPALLGRFQPALTDGGLPGKKIAFDLQLADLAVQIVDDLLRIVDRRRLVATHEQLTRFISSCFQVPIIVGWTPNSDDSSASVFSPDSAAIATRALKSALCCFLFTPTSHASLDRSALSLSDCPENRSRRKQDRPDVAQARKDWRESQPKLDSKRLVFIDETWTKGLRVNNCFMAVVG